ncbi:hypothetical protein H7J73_04075 [Mycolicibacterium komossense]|uniref:Integral membrane protein n=1 Tax=Mycolicibacterium komossense TaxID=1779 RepID=A0ABT3C6X2_9MYCO|nr:hypothetical protein [Mycolicibacterium komossense]
MTAVISPDAAERVAAESWFLKRGLPVVLTRRARWRRLWSRSAPALTAFATFMAVMSIINLLPGEDGDPDSVNINGAPSGWDIVVLALIVLIVPATIATGALTARVASTRGRRLAALIAVAIAVACTFLQGALADDLTFLMVTVLTIVVVMLLVGLGIGSVLGWAVRLTGSHLASAGTLFARALPVVLLTVLVFFNSYVWVMATKISRDRMWLVIDFMVLIACAFLLTGIVDRVRPMLAKKTVRNKDIARLIGTPFEEMPDPDTAVPLSRLERFNVIFVVAASQIAQILTVAFVTCAIFFTMGLLALSPDVLADWTHNGPTEGTVLGMQLPVPQPLIHVTMFLGALTFMYISARAVGDGDYRESFLDPLIDDLRFTLVARNRYRTHIGRQPS